MVKLNIGGRSIGENYPTYIVAEAGINHNGDLNIAKELVDAAVDVGVDAVKFQTYETEKRVDEDSELFDILDKCELERGQFAELFEYAEPKDVQIFSTPFDSGSVELLDELDIPVYKVASFHITHKRLLQAIAETGKPVICSTGTATQSEVTEAAEFFERHDTPYVLLHCVSSYPTEETDANIEVVRSLNEMFSCPVGFSDHTLGTLAPVLSIAAGGAVIEKHFTLDRDMDGPDHSLSQDPEGMAALVEEIRRAEQVLGDGSIRRLDSEKPVMEFREETEAK